MKQKINKLTVIITCLLMVICVISCEGKQAERDYSNVVVDEPLMFDPAKASLNGISHFPSEIKLMLIMKASKPQWRWQLLSASL